MLRRLSRSLSPLRRRLVTNPRGSREKPRTRRLVVRMHHVVRVIAP